MIRPFRRVCFDELCHCEERSDKAISAQRLLRFARNDTLMYLRIWQSCDIAEVTKHLLIVGDITADCAACRELGIEYASAKSCPQCKTVFRFIAARNTGPLDRDRGGTVKRIKDRRPDLTFIDYDDYKNITGKQNARDFFK